MAGKIHVPASKLPPRTPSCFGSLRPSVQLPGEYRGQRTIVMPAQLLVNTRNLTLSLPIVFTVNLDFLLIRAHQEGVAYFENYFLKTQLAIRYHMCFTISFFHIFHYYFMFPTRIFCRRYLTTQSDGSLMASIRVWNSLGEERRGELAKLHSPVSGRQPGTSVSNSCCWLGAFQAPGFALSILYRRVFLTIQWACSSWYTLNIFPRPENNQRIQGISSRSYFRKVCGYFLSIYVYYIELMVQNLLSETSGLYEFIWKHLALPTWGAHLITSPLGRGH